MSKELYTISFEFWIQIMVYKIIYVLDMYSLLSTFFIVQME